MLMLRGYHFHFSILLSVQNLLPFGIISFSADAGTEFEKASYGTIIGKTSLKLDVYLCVGRDLEAKNKADTDAIQEKIRKTILADADILNEFSELNCSKIMAMDIPGENGLRVLCHDFEVSWLAWISNEQMLSSCFFTIFNARR